MKEKFLIIALPFLINLETIYTQGIINDTIIWNSDFKLLWKNFMGSPPEDMIGAGTNSGISINTIFSGDRILVEIFCYFIQSESWVSKNSKTEYLLNHEQKHFDITEIYARKLRNACKNGNFLFSELSEGLDSLYGQINNTLWEVHDQYDIETSHSKNMNNQIQWDSCIAQELKKLEEFEEPIVILNEKVSKNIKSISE